TALDKASTRTWNIGKPHATSFMALSRFKLWWMMPCHSDRAGNLPPETQMVLMKLPIGEAGVLCLRAAWYPEVGKQMYGVLIPLIDGPAKCTLKGLPDQSLQLFCETGCEDTPVPSSDVAGLFVGVHEDPFKLIE
ncbi:unnamed protein product, partial [Discosporangium mesarthrocarpum]